MMIKTDALVARSRTGPSKALTIFVCVIFGVASCTDYKATLKPATEDASAETVLPRSAVAQKAIVRTEEKVTGSVRLRVDVSDTGDVSGVEIIEASDDRLKEKALDLILSWPMEPGTIAGEPAKFENLEYTMVFITDDSTTTGEVIGTTVLVVLLLPLALALALFSGGSSFKMGN